MTCKWNIKDPQVWQAALKMTPKDLQLLVFSLYNPPPESGLELWTNWTNFRDQNRAVVYHFQD